MEPTFRDRAVLLGETLVLADLHLGRGEATAVEVPVGDGVDVLDRLRDLLDTFDPETVVFAGDLLHAFERVPRGVERQVRALQDAVEARGAKAVAVEGNHDAMLETVWDGALVDAHRLDEATVVVHGHERPGVDAERYVLGHDHPSIEIEGQRRPCWLRGPGGPDGTELLGLPAFNRLAPGVAVNGMHARDFQSPLVVDADRLAPVVRDPDAGETLSFPPLGRFRHRL